MKKQLIYLSILLFCSLLAMAQVEQAPPTPAPTTEMIFVSDTQQPMWVEKILLKPNRNSTATADILAEILRRKPQSLYMLGDVVGLGYRNKKWRKVDIFLDSCRKAGTNVCGILGNHEIMGRRKKGELNFAKRFPMNLRTGYVSLADSVAIVLLNSNFNSLSPTELKKQQSWYEDVLAELDKTDSIKAVIVACHHAPFSNSKVVKGSGKVQQYFVPAYIKSKKAQLFVTGHAHVFEHFKQQGKDFVVIGGGGGLHQPLSMSANRLPDLAADYKPMFHYLSVQRIGDNLAITSHFLKDNFSGFEIGHSFILQPGSDKVPMQSGQ
ncbi:MAG: metallophosphoesterase [Ferruginibacter sp.]